MTFPYIWTKKKFPVKIVTWADGTIDELRAMLGAHDEGLINIYDYWSVGDERTVHLNAATEVSETFETNLPAQDVVMVLMNEGYPTGEQQYDNSHIHYVVGQKDCLSVKAKMHNESTLNSTIMGSRLCYYTFAVQDSIYKTMLGDFWSYLNNPAYVTIENSSKNGVVTASNVTVTLPAEKEVFGERTHSYTEEANALQQFDYYKTAANRIKKIAGSASQWWLRSRSTTISSITGAEYCCVVNSDGTPTGYQFTTTKGVAPIMFI